MDSADNPIEAIERAPRAEPMQLRVARLCLDCEELHVADACPICASERYAFLSIWLPSEERRRWRRPALAPAAAPNRLRRIQRAMARLLGFPEPIEPQPRLRTRASDRVPRLDFEAIAKEPAPSSTPLDPRPASAGRDAQS